MFMKYTPKGKDLRARGIDNFELSNPLWFNIF